MTRLGWLKRREHRLAVVMGLVDGILTAMLLAARRMMGHGAPVDAETALKVAVSALATAGFVFYIGRYAELRSHLVRAEVQLNLWARGTFATTRLGRMVLLDACREAFLSGGCSFVSALAPLLLAVIFPFLPWLSVIASLGMLALLGAVLGSAVGGSPAAWATGLTGGGLLMMLLGFLLNIV